VSTGQPPTELAHDNDADVDVVLDETVGERAVVARSPGQLFWRRLRRDKVAMAALYVIIALVAIAFLAPLIIRIFGVPGPRVQNSNAVDLFGSPTGPSSDHPFGVDRLGRDIFSRTSTGRASRSRSRSSRRASRCSSAP